MKLLKEFKLCRKELNTSKFSKQNRMNYTYEARFSDVSPHEVHANCSHCLLPNLNQKEHILTNWVGCLRKTDGGTLKHVN